MAQYGEINGIYRYRTNPNVSSLFSHQYEVSRTDRDDIKWETMEEILGIDDKFPMIKYCSTELITEYHDCIIEFSKKTLLNNNNNDNDNNEINENIFLPNYDVEEILDEKQDIDNDILFLIKWRGWPKEYNSWELISNLNEYTQKELISNFRRKNNHKQLGAQGFAKNYWSKLYAKEWQPFVDGMHNADDHSDYAYSFFKKLRIHKEITHIADFGFGPGTMLHSFCKKFKAKMAYGLEPSQYAFDKYINSFNENIKLNKNYFRNCHVCLECIDLIQYFKRENMTIDQIKIYNKHYKKTKQQNNNNKCRKKKLKKKNKNISMDMDIDEFEDNANDKENDVNMMNINEILNNNNYKEFCYCSRGKNQNYYKNKLNKLSKEKKNKNLLLSIYDKFNCSCYKKFDGSYNLGLCVSVLQYLNDNDVDIILNKLSHHCDFLYFDVVTEEEYNIMNNGSTFRDKWAISRPRKFYLNIILKYWRIISNEILESKFFYPDNASSNAPNTIYIIDKC